MVANVRHVGQLCFALWLAGVLAEPLWSQEGGRGPRERRGGERRQRAEGPGEASADGPGGGRTFGPPGSGGQGGPPMGPPGGGFPGGGFPGGGPPGGFPGGGFPGGGMPWGPPGGGFPGGGPPGGFPGGGFPGGGMPWGPPGGGFPGGGPAGWMARLDANGNGMLDPEEAQGRARMFLERTGLDLSRPIPMDKVTRAFEEMRSRREQEGGRGEEGGTGDRAPVKQKPPALVPGFGEPELFDPVPGFGDLGEKFAVAIEEEDRQEALRTMARSDVNQDGVLDADEIRNGRWSDDPLQTDRNGDGKLTLTELALRYAIRRVEREGTGGAARTSARGGPPLNVGGGPNAKEEGRGRNEEFAANMGARVGGRGGGGPQGEPGRWFARREGEEGGGSPPKAAAAPEQENPANGKKSYRIRTSTERLAGISGLPEWFGRLDAGGDGQVSMAEYSSSWNEQVVADFAQFDLNHDGIITPEECVQATEAGAVQGALPSAGPSASHGERRQERDGERMRAQDGEGPREQEGERRREGNGPRMRQRDGEHERNGEDPGPPPAAEPAASAAAASPTPVAPSSSGADMQKYVKYAVSFIRRYDTNKDGVLTKDEWSKMNSDYIAADADQDGRITPVELATLFMKK